MKIPDDVDFPDNDTPLYNKIFVNLMTNFAIFWHKYVATLNLVEKMPFTFTIRIVPMCTYQRIELEFIELLHALCHTPKKLLKCTCTKKLLRKSRRS